MNESDQSAALKLWTFRRPAAAYLCAAFVLFLACTAGANAYASVRLDRQPWGDAILEHFGSEAMDPVGFIARLAPIGFAGLVGAAFHRALGLTKALLILCVLSTFILYWYVQGYWFSHVYMREELWTAASLALGFNVMKAGGLVLVVCLARNWIVQRLRRF